MTPYKTRFAHAKCLEQIIENASVKKAETAKKRKAEREKVKKEKAMLSQPTPVTPTSTSEEEYTEKQEVYKFIEKITGSKPTGKDYGLISKYKRDYGFTYKGMLNALIYYFEGLEKQSDSGCSSIIPYVYEDAQEFMRKWEEAKSYNESIPPEKLRRYYSHKEVIPLEVVLKPRRKISDKYPDIFGRGDRGVSMFEDIDNARAAGLPEPHYDPEPMSEEDKEWIKRFIRGDFDKNK